ncbi:FAD binding domain-containing protein [Vacuolonema iberomarrocanum]|uniref:FAD binding domain-containing protein n=1 Tax=Vacuolonema iberomarrocanum TaxID=3454632 RepID=UPI0019DB103D|nr:xanthine dehydrogenase family protein subunit M [filamentous cyanobacterium LEGE 07170]
MNNFIYARASSVQDAIARTAEDPTATVIAGGTNLVDRLKVFLEEPSQLIDISRLQMQQIERLPDGGLQIGALVTNTALADHADIRRDYPLLARAILRGASQQIRNMATVGGNIMQRTRCPYYYDTAFACNKRQPGVGCPAIDGVNRLHAILGASDQCVAVHPSDMCVALAALDAIVEVAGTQGQRQIPFVDFHRLPGDTPQRDTNLELGELITRIILPPVAYARSGVYLKLRDRASYAFALVSAAAALNVSGEEIRTARLALGGVAHKPWRATIAEQFLIGQPATSSVFEKAANLALQEAVPLSGNQYKVDLARRLIRRAFAVSANSGGMA